MSGILDQIQADLTHFQPATSEQYFALQLARKLGDITAARRYAGLVEHHSEDVLVGAFQKCVTEATLTSEHFMRQLQSLVSEEDGE